MREIFTPFTVSPGYHVQFIGFLADFPLASGLLKEIQKSV
jgi:hypothetical protein